MTEALTLPPQEEADIVASQCVECITEFIDVLREEFALPKRAPHPSAEVEVDVVRLCSILEQQSYVKKVTELHTKAFQLYQTKESIQDAACWLLPQTWNQDAASLTAERFNLVRGVLLPLVASLGYCFEILDRLVITPPSKPSRDRQKPPPPIGMLSLKNYTDIACLVEFIICTSVLPFLPPNVLAPISERVRYHLPKSLAGRLPRSSLLWGTTAQQSSTKLSAPLLIEEWEAVVSVLGRFLLLDRFRPMLLPRHVCDIMAVMVYIDTHRHMLSSNEVTSSYPWVVERWMGDTKPTSTLVLDSYWQAKAYQGLLRKGRDAPSWLRSAISQRLTALATHDLLVLIAVFVQEAIDQEFSAAALRLAGALIPKNRTEACGETERDDYVCSICDQLLVVLDSMTLSPSAMSSKDASSIETVWAVLNLLPSKIINGYFFERIILNEFVQPDNDDALSCPNIGRIVARFRNLFSLPPSTANNSIFANICLLLFKPLFLSPMKCNNAKNMWEDLTAIGAIVRLAATPCVEKSEVKDDAILMLRLFVSIMKSVQFFNDFADVDPVPGTEILNIMLLHSLAPTAWDINGLSFDLQSQNGDSVARPEPLLIRKGLSNGSPSLNWLTEGVEFRANMIVRQVLLKDDNRCDSTKDNQLLLLFFQTLLTIYFYCGSTKDSNTEHSFLLHNEGYRLVSMVSLPLLCEVCSPELLLSCNCETEIFDVVKIVLDGAVSRVPSVDTTKSFQGNTGDSRTIDHRVRNALDYLMLKFEPDDSLFLHRQPLGSVVFDGPDREMVLSVTALVLGLLVSSLELGAKTRSVQDEKALQSLTPGLLRLADSSAFSSNDEASLMSAHAQIAEIASFALALIASRSVASDDDNLVNDEREPSVGFLVEAENALRSDLPPLRARAMVLLRNRANAISEQLKHLENLEEKQIYLEELYTTLGMSLEALKDSESYVYLAAIHTIVAVADAQPSELVSILGIAVVTGELDLEGKDKVKLSPEQRTKLTEALMFIIRRGITFYEHLPLLMRLLVVGLRSNGVSPSISIEEVRYIQEATHIYFVKGPETSSIGDEEEHFHSRKEYWNELDIRVRTGGPLFQTEEGDIVRSAMVMVVSELLVVLSPSVTARYSSHLVNCCIDMLRLESSRSVRRAGAALSRELFGSLVREQVELMEAISCNKPFDVHFSRSMTESREAVLFSILQGIVSQLEGTPEDPATMARCREAIQLRQEASDGGILLAGKVALESQQQCDDNPIARLLTRTRPRAVPPTFVGIEEFI